MQSSLIHLGCGALGLGLIVPEIHSVVPEMDIYICNRKTKGGIGKDKTKHLAEKKHYLIRKGSNDYFQRFTDFIYFDEKDRLVEIINRPQIVFITTALKETGVTETIDLLAEVIHQRNVSKIKEPLVFIACENAINSKETKELIRVKLQGKYGTSSSKYYFQDNIFFLNTVVDRICNKPVFEKANLLVRTEEFGSWIIEDTSKAGFRLIKEALAKSEHISFEKNIDFYIRRKKWIVNSIHQLIALYTHALNFHEIDAFVQTNDGAEILDNISKEILKIYLFNEKTADSGEASAFVEIVKSRLENFPSNVFTALTRFTDPLLMPSFFQDFFRKVGEPTLNFLMSNNEGLRWIPLINLKIGEMISKQNFVIQQN